MDLYNRDIYHFKNNILNNEYTAEIIKRALLDYENRTEISAIIHLINEFKETGREEVLERLHNVLEIEIIFNNIWSLDEQECVLRIYTFDLSIVYGSSFMVEFVKMIKNMYADVPHADIISSVAFRNLYGVMAVKFFKSKKRAEEYFATFVENARNIPGINLSETQKQLTRFTELFPN